MSSADWSSRSGFRCELQSGYLCFPANESSQLSIRYASPSSQQHCTTNGFPQLHVQVYTFQRICTPQSNGTLRRCRLVGCAGGCMSLCVGTSLQRSTPRRLDRGSRHRFLRTFCSRTSSLRRTSWWFRRHWAFSSRVFWSCWFCWSFWAWRSGAVSWHRQEIHWWEYPRDHHTLLQTYKLGTSLFSCDTTVQRILCRSCDHSRLKVVLACRSWSACCSFGRWMAWVLTWCDV